MKQIIFYEISLIIPNVETKKNQIPFNLIYEVILILTLLLCIPIIERQRKVTALFCE